MATETQLETQLSDTEAHADSIPEQLLAGSAAPGHDGTSLLDILIVLAERKRTILWITAISAILCAIASFVLPKRYTAKVTLLPPQQNSSLSAQLASQFGSIAGLAALGGGGGSSLLKNPNDMYVGMLKSRTVEDAMIDHFGLMQEYHKKYRSDTRKKLEHYAIIDGSGKDGMIHISVDDSNPQRAADLANGYVDQFRDLSQHLAITEAQQRRLFFENQLKQANQNLADAEEALKETEQKTGLIQLDSQARALIQSAATLHAQIAVKEMQIQGMQTYATGENSQLVQVQQELASLQAQLAKLGGAGDGSDNIIAPRGQMTQAGMQYVRRLRDVKYYETIFDILARQFELAKLDEAKEGAIVQVVDPAVTPDKKSFPKLSIFLLVGIVGGLIVGVFAVLVQRMWVEAQNDVEISERIERLQNSLYRVRRRAEVDHFGQKAR